MDKEFPKGIFIKRPNEGAPEFVKFSIGIKREEAIAWLNSKSDEWVNLQGLTSREGKLYLAVDNWKPQGDTPQGYPEYDQEQGNPEQGGHESQYSKY